MKKLYATFFFIGAIALTLGLAIHSSKNTDSPEPITKEPVTPMKYVEIPERGGEIPPGKVPEISKSLSDFRRLTSEAYTKLPPKKILNSTGRDLHMPPPELSSAAAELGKIEDALDSDPKLTREGMQFYKKCALDDSLLTSIRAVCLHDLKTRAAKAGIVSRSNWSGFPEDVRRIADHL